MLIGFVAGCVTIAVCLLALLGLWLRAVRRERRALLEERRRRRPNGTGRPGVSRHYGIGR